MYIIKYYIFIYTISGNPIFPIPHMNTKAYATYFTRCLRFRVLLQRSAFESVSKFNSFQIIFKFNKMPGRHILSATQRDGMVFKCSNCEYATNKVSAWDTHRTSCLGKCEFVTHPIQTRGVRRTPPPFCQKEYTNYSKGASSRHLKHPLMCF